MEGGSVLHGFAIERILSSDARTKSITVLGRFEDREGRAVVTLRRQHFEEKLLPRLMSQETHADLHFQNDVYSKVRETCEMYCKVVKPYIDSLPPERIHWVYNILEKKAEADRLIFEDADPDTGFVLHPDLKWDERQIEALYCIAIVNRRDIRSLRDLRGNHLPLLQNLQEQGTAAVTKRYNIEPDQLRVYIHYQPSYYHLHVHFVHVKYDAGMGMAVGKAHFLDGIIGNLSLSNNHYEATILHTVLGAKDPLAERIKSCNLEEMDFPQY